MPEDALKIPLNVVCFGGRDIELTDEVRAVVSSADLIFGLGDVDLQRISSILGSNKPALCVLGDCDPRQRPPLPFRPLHGTGFAFNGWRVSGLSGGISNISEGSGFTLSNAEAKAILSEAPFADIILSHIPPAGMQEELETSMGLDALRSYISRVHPFYHFFASSGGEVSTIYENALIVGVDGIWAMPLDFGLA